MSRELMNESSNTTGNAVENDKNKAGLAAEGAMTLAQVREKLKGANGPRFWRSVDELANTPEFQAAVEKEFPSAAAEWVDPVSRRGFLKLMGASMALAGLAGCTKQPDEPIYPYVKAPEDLILGKPNYFATAMPFVSGRAAAAGEELISSARSRSTEIPIMRITRGLQMSSRRARCWTCTIRIGRSM